MPSNDQTLYGERGGQSRAARFVSHSESYGPHVIERFALSLPSPETCVDLGAGSGRDLAIVKNVHPSVRRIAVEGGHEYARGLEGKAEEVHVLDIERDVLPFTDESIDLFIANQVLEHTKEVFWIFHEVTRALKVGGHFIFGVPNVASLHNRVLLPFGVHPTQSKLCSGHVRCFSKRDTLRFLEAVFPGGYHLADFAGSQFYPLPARASRVAARLFPSAAVCIFFLVRKEKPYAREFATYPAKAHFETNFWSGSVPTDSQY